MSFIVIFIASLLGSPHCAGMCGGFVSLSSQSSSPIKSQSAYHFGRLLTYMALGVIAGSIGTAVNSLGSQLGITHIATILTATLLIVSGLSILSHRSFGLQNVIPTQKLLSLQKKLLPDRSRFLLFPLILGLLTTLLPCGWLYTYVVVAAGTGSPLWGLCVMTFFWMGTLPILITIGSLANLISLPLKKYIPTVISLLMITAGALSLAGHLGIGPFSHHSTEGEECLMHHHES